MGLSSYVAIDLETTGLDPTVHQIIDVGAVRFRSGRPESEFRSFVRADRPLDPFITDLTGITDPDLLGAPQFSEISQALLDFIGADPLVGQNVEFDLGFLRAAGESVLPRAPGERFAFFQARVLDTALLARIFWAELPSFSLAALCSTFGIELRQAHRALDDARATGSVLATMLRSLPFRVWGELTRDLNWLVSGTTHRSRFFFAALDELAADIKSPVPARLQAEEEKGEEPRFGWSLDQLFGKDGIFEQHLPFFRFRPMQLALAVSVETAFEKNHILFAEAPTGVGKSLAYLAPALRWVMADPEAGRQVVVSSHTKVLQEQLFRKDMSEVRTAIGGGFRAAVLKGRNNYLCKRRLRSLVRESRERLTDVDRMQIMPLLRWAELTMTGDISEISGFNPRNLPFLWSQVASDSLACAGAACGAAKGDFYRVAQERAARAHVLFVNHALLVSDLPRFTSGFKKLVLDEAHQIERAMVGAMTVEISPAVFRNALSRLLDERTSRGMLGAVAGRLKHGERGSSRDITSLLSQVRGLYAISRQGFTYLADQLVRMIGESDRTARQRFRVGDKLHSDICRALGPLLSEWSEFSSALRDFVFELADLRGDERLPPETLIEVKSALDGVEQIRDQLVRILREDDPNAVTWAEFGRSPHNNWCTLHTAPVSVGKIMGKVFWPVVESVILTSATLTASGTFDVLKESLGLDVLPPERVHSTILASPFRLDEQMRTFVPTYLPAPRTEDTSHSDATVELIVRMVERFPRGTLILSTSNLLVDKLTSALNPVARKANRRLLSQGISGSLAELVAEFRRLGNAILIGAASFWEGIDVVGDALQILIVTRIPFDVPTDPWVAARCDALQAAGHDAFAEYSLPVSALRLKQGIGRLIRHPQDRGIAIVTDPRLFRSRYGRMIRESLPSVPIAVNSEVELFKEVEQFFES